MKTRNLFWCSVVAAIVLGVGLWRLPKRVRTVPDEGPLLVYCAAGLKAPVEAVVKDAQKELGSVVELQYGGSGTLLANVRVAGRGDLFLAADESYIEVARGQGLIREVVPLARMTPVVILRKADAGKVRSIQDLLAPGISLALASPEAASIGRTLRELFQARGEWERLQKQVKVFKPTVNDVANDVRLGTVDAGVVWDALVPQYPDLVGVPLPEFLPAAQTVSVAVLSACRQPAAALRFARYLAARDRGLKTLGTLGYRVVEGDVWKPTPELVLYSGAVNRVAIEESLREFESREGVRVTRVYNGCGILVAQMKAGQRPDAYLACDNSFMAEVTDLFSAPVEISETDMVILVKKGNAKGIQGLESLVSKGLKVGVANAKQSALGELTARMLRRAGCYDGVMENVVMQSPTGDLLVNETASGALDAAIVYEVNARQATNRTEMIRIRAGAPTAVQPFAVGRSSENRHLAERLLAALRSAESKERYKRAGFGWRGGAP